MIRLAWHLTVVGGRGRAVLLAACTAVVGGLLLVGQAMLLLPEYPQEALYSVVADAGTRSGFAFAVFLLALPALLLLFQAVRLGTSARERRLAALRLAGATPGDVRRLGALEVGLPTFAGAVAGYGVYRLMRGVFGGAPVDAGCCEPGVTRHGSLAGFVPTSVAPAWWQVLLTVLVVTVLGVIVGTAANRGVVVSPLGIARRTSSNPPRPWGLLLVVAGIGFGVSALVLFGTSELVDLLAPLASIALLVVGLISLAPWTAYVVGRTARRARTAPVLLAARRLAGDPRPAGRAAAAVGAIGLVAGGAAAMAADILETQEPGDRAYYLVAIGLVGVGLLLALLAVIGSLAIHSVESLLDRKRSVASLAALGGTTGLLAQSQRAEVGLVAMPMALGGTLLGSLLIGIPLAGLGLPWAVATALALGAVAGLVWSAVRLAVLITGPWIRKAADPANLRTA
ncbi:FtsX-like permease family protein [Nocardioides aquiterrae]|uniref:ABC3 transporter permease C-terminal domain-containing protein n=1 Tax=Nocardioides aquiterrae TaxID=203799 RepID=A0ABN1UEJ3_9ACTN